MPLTAKQVYRDFVTDGVPSSGRNKPDKAEIRSLLTGYESAINAAGGNIGTVYQTRAALFADLTKPANTMAWVTSDPVAANNGVYQKIGPANSGSWTRLSDLPYDFVSGVDAGDGAPNAIKISASIAVSESMIVAFTLFQDTAATPVTVSINDGPLLTLKTNRGNDASALTAGMDVWFRIRGTEARLLNDQDVAALVGQAEAAQAAAEAARDAALAAVPSIFALTRTALKAIDTTLVTAAYLKEAGREGQFLWKTGNFSSQITADTTEAIYIKANAIASTSGAWVRVYDGLNINTNWCGGNWQAAIDLASVLGVPTVTPVGTYTATSGTGALKMRAGITLHNFAGTATLTQANGAQLGNLLDFATYAANAAKVINITIDGNRANNTDDIAAKHLILIYDTNDVVLQGCTITGANGNGILVREGVRNQDPQEFDQQRLCHSDRDYQSYKAE